MADSDWDNFMSSTTEGNEEVETPEKGEDEDLEVDQVVEIKKTPAGSTEEGEEDLEDPAKPPVKVEKPAAVEDAEVIDPKKPADPVAPAAVDDGYKPRLTQFFDKDGKISAEKIEKGYIESSKESVRLAQDLKEQQEGNREILAKIANDPELAKRFFTPEQIADIEKSGGVPDPSHPKEVDPVRGHFEAQLLKTQREEYDTFVDANPTATTDSIRANKISEFIPVHRDLYRKENGGLLPSMKDTLEAAFRYHGWELAEDAASKNDSETAVRKAKEEAEALKSASRKDAAATNTPSGAKKAPAQNQFSKEAIFFANKLGFTADDLKKSVKK